jgi:hypothetical protein
MLRRDFKPSRFALEIQAAKKFIQSKLSRDMKDRISVISLSENTKKIIDFTYVERNLIGSLKKIKISAKGIFHEGLSFALQILVDEMRKLGGKTSRIFIITDNNLDIDMNKLERVVNIAKGLGVYIDICQLGGIQDHERMSLKRIAQVTKGEYGYFSNSKELLNSLNLFTSKKEERETIDYFSPDKKEDIAPLISEIALPLRRLNVLEIRLMMGDKYQIEEKCQICHSSKAPATGAGFYSEGRYCPSCDRAMHLSCAAMWAKKTEYKENIFRCPFCFFLLELPRSALKYAEEVDEESQEIRILDEEEEVQAQILLIPEDEIDQIDASCSYCHSIFLGDYRVYQCNKCASYYHKPCLEKMTNEIGACRYCGAKIALPT